MSAVSSAADLANALAAHGVRFASGVPCSLLGRLDGALAALPDVRHVPATVEGEAVALAAGAWLGGARAAVYMQNSGLGNAVNVLTSLNGPFSIPAVLVVTWRGRPGTHDEPQHQTMGAVTPSLLDLLGIPHWTVARDRPVAPVVAEACAVMDATHRPVALVVPAGALASVRDRPPEVPRRRPRAVARDLRRGRALASRRASLRTVLDALADDTAVVAATGHGARELFVLADHPRQFPMVGSMGSASSIGLGVALASGRRVVVLDGDGAALMRLGSLATLGAFGDAALIHVVLDNGSHASTGGQATAAANVDFAAVAAACGYGAATATDDLDGLHEALAAEPPPSGARFVHHRIDTVAPGALPRVPSDLAALGDRFRRFVCSPKAVGSP